MKTWSTLTRKYAGKGILLFSLVSLSASCYCSGCYFDQNRADTTRKIQSSSLRVLKLNPFQVLTGEIPVSWEVFKGENRSIQYQLGILIPVLRENTGYIFPSPTTNLISLRTMPYFSYGLSSKIEFRAYGKRKYIAIQAMYKYAAYDNVSFRVWDQDPIYESFDQLESKSSHILGLGFMTGRQRYNKRFVTDKYFGLGLRLRLVDGTIEAQEFGSPRGRIMMNKRFEYTSVYPIINFGIRFGKTFPRKNNL